MRTRTILPALAALVLVAPALARAATVTILNADPPNVGFNDPTPATPIGGNTGTTKGAQALQVFQRAAAIWGAKLDSNVEVRVIANFQKLTCTATTAVLGSAGALYAEADFPHAPLAGTWYPVALANKLSGVDLVTEADAPSTLGADIRARFNSGLGAPDCLAGTRWYFGLDTGHAAGEINLLTVVLHEVGHGLGFASFANVSTGTLFAGMPDVYSTFYYDFAAGKTRLEMTDAERKASAVSGQIVWTGERVTANAPPVLAPTPALFVTAPSGIAGTYAVGTASFGAPLTLSGVSGPLALAVDAADTFGPLTTDGCSAITSDVAGKLALVDRGTCPFTQKALNAQLAGAIGVVVADNVVRTLPGLGGADPRVTVPTVMVTLATGNLLKANLATGVDVRIGLDPTRKAGMLNGFVKLYSPNPVEPGSSVSHYDVSTSPNQLMEPAINADLRIAVDLPYDLTRSLLRDVGWYPDADLDLVADDAGDQCLGSDLRRTVYVGTLDTGVTNTLFTNGCTISDLVRQCSGDTHGDYVACVVEKTDALRASGALVPGDQGAIRAAAARSN